MINFNSHFKNKNFKKQDISQSEITDILEKTDVGTWVWNIQTGEVRLSERCLEIFGYSKEEFENTTREILLTKLHKDDLNGTLKSLKRHFEGEYPYYRRENRYEHKEGHFVWVFERGYVIEKDIEGDPLVMFGTYADITSRKQLEFALENYINTLNHDLRSPLSIILGYSNYLVEEDLSQEEVKKFANIINQTSKKMLKMMESYLSLAKIEKGQEIINKKVITVAEIIEELKNYFINLQQTDRANILFKDLKNQMQPQNLIEKSILIDDNLFYSLISNLIHNALEASKEKAVVHVFEEKKNLCISVFNQGEIPLSMQKKLFKRFASSKKNGTGMGLYSARLIARAHGGDIIYIPEEGGTRFIFKIAFA